MITGKGNKGIISVVPGVTPQRERFSIAHELGHWAMHRGETVACRSTDIGKFSKGNEVERAADQYAASLLMPWSLFKTECRQHRRLDLEALKAVSTAFNTSQTATLIQIIDSYVYPTAIMISHGTGGRVELQATGSRRPISIPKASLLISSTTRMRSIKRSRGRLTLTPGSTIGPLRNIRSLSSRCGFQGRGSSRSLIWIRA
ncbi:ImmA/IrrE family metallo-endopeptidase [Rhizobium laguerreae]|uniref:ImmA/IrrE family metallo-endopeptidase n=1 Tax=Rhizobium laguerreae TaxID=1076926 RepID=UPI001FD5EB75|nr:ImmA/IrrE family metallo-endopeptidase [Rhizobium laguerreae]